ADSKDLRDLGLRQVLPVIEKDHASLPRGQDLEVIEKRVNEQAAFVELRQVLPIDAALLHGREQPLDPVADANARAAKRAKGADRIANDGERLVRSHALRIPSHDEFVSAFRVRSRASNRPSGPLHALGSSALPPVSRAVREGLMKPNRRRAVCQNVPAIASNLVAPLSGSTT